MKIKTKNIEEMSNYELGLIAQNFLECGASHKCSGCVCEGILCGHADFEKQREIFNREIIKRLMKL